MKTIKILFEKWYKIKIKIQSKERKIYFKEREIWWTSLGANIGFEQDGKNCNFERPVLVLKKFNKDIFWSLPLTTKNKKGKYYLKLDYNNPKSSLILSQLKLISSKRLIRKIRVLPEKEFKQVRKKIKKLL